jgi:hypothetical protein
LGDIEVALISSLRAAQKKDIEAPIMLMAVLSALLLALGVIKPYVDIYQHRIVLGISFIFVNTDKAGDLFSFFLAVFMINYTVARSVTPTKLAFKPCSQVEISESSKW